jgi:hypothetical protein
MADQMIVKPSLPSRRITKVSLFREQLSEKVKQDFFINFDRKIDTNSFSDWSVKSSNNKNHSSFCMEQDPFHMREFSQFILWFREK